MSMMPGNPIVGGVALRRPAISSPNYVLGTTGWTINADGTAEFNNVTVRGTVIAGNPPTGNRVVIDGVNGNIFIYNNSNVQVIALNSLTSSLTVTDGTNTFSVSASGGITINMVGLTKIFGRLNLDGSVGVITWDDGLGTVDTQISRGAAGLVLVNDSLRVVGEVQLSNTRWAISGSNATEQQTMASGSSVVTTDVNGNCTIATGLTQVRGFVAYNGDVTVRSNIVVSNNRTGFPPVAGGNVGLKCQIGNTGGPLVSLSVRIDWIAFGVL